MLLGLKVGLGERDTGPLEQILLQAVARGAGTVRCGVSVNHWSVRYYIQLPEGHTGMNPVSTSPLMNA